LASKKTIIAFAHRGEARAFLSEYSCKPTSFKENLFFKEDLYLLIAGEGIYRAINELSHTIGILQALYSDSPLEIFNFGICGALEKDILIGEVRKIRSIYSTDSVGEPQFKSFTHSSVKRDPQELATTSDIITSHKRILDSNDRETIRNFAPLVDREAWGFAYAADAAGESLKAFKLVSDYADAEVCQVVKEQAREWSESLLETYLSLAPSPEALEAPELPQGLSVLHITLSQKRRLINLLRALELKGIKSDEAFQLCGLQELLRQEKRSKEITKDLIQNLHALVYPLNAALEDRLQKQVAPLKKVGFQVKFDQDLEREILHLGATLSSVDQIQRIQAALGEFDFEQYVRLLRGQDVH